jgi:hypothetical protein
MVKLNKFFVMACRNFCFASTPTSNGWLSHSTHLVSSFPFSYNVSVTTRMTDHDIVGRIAQQHNQHDQIKASRNMVGMFPTWLEREEEGRQEANQRHDDNLTGKGSKIDGYMKK